MTDKWDRSSKDDFNKAAARRPLSDRFNEKATEGAKDPPDERKDRYDKPELKLNPPGMGSSRWESAWDHHKAQRMERQGRSGGTPEVEKEDPKLSRNFNNRAKP